MHIGVLAILEGAPLFDATGRFRLDELRAHLGSRLHLVPRFRTRPTRVPFGIGRPVWVDDPHFDVAAHVRLTSLPSPGSRAQLLACFKEIQAQRLDRSRPLWELWFVEGLDDGNVAMVQKIHHALVDGVADVDVATVLFDFDRTAAAPSSLLRTGRRAHRPCRPNCSPTRWPRSWPTWRTWAESSPTRCGCRGAPSPPWATWPARWRRWPTGDWSRPDSASTSRSGANAGSSGPRSRWADVEFVRRSLGGTVNDVVLAVVAGALRRLLDASGELRPGLSVKVLCPVSVRADDERGALGNRVAALVVPLPVGESDAGVRLTLVCASTREAKERHQAEAAGALVGLTRYAVGPFLGLIARAAHHQVLFNLVATNVPGPPVPLYCMGAQVLEAYPMVPLARNLGLGIAMLSYCDRVFFGLLADREAVPDLGVLARGVVDSLDELRARAETRGPLASGLDERA